MAKYTGATNGNKKTWTTEGKLLFNKLMSSIYLDREINGISFDKYLQKFWKNKYSKKINSATEKRKEQLEAAKLNYVVTYNDESIRDLIKINRKPQHAISQVEERDEEEEIDHWESKESFFI